jgi:hypothetical protein
MNEVAGGVEQLEAAVRHPGLEQVDLLGAGDRVVAALDQTPTSRSRSDRRSPWNDMKS